MTGNAPGFTNTIHRREAAKIDPNSNRNLSNFGLFNHQLDLLLVSDVPRVQPKAIDATLQGFQSQLVVEVYVGDERNVDLAFDLF